MKDVFGRDLHIGATVIYVYTLGSSTRMHKMVVTGFTPQKVRIVPGEGVGAGYSPGTVSPTSLILYPEDRLFDTAA